WLSLRPPAARLPGVSHGTWCRKGADGRFLWPGFGDHLRVLEWIIGRVKGEAGGQDTPIGTIPGPGDLALDGLDLDEAALATLLDFDRDGWRAEAEAISGFLGEFGSRTPARLVAEHQRLRDALAG